MNILSKVRLIGKVNNNSGKIDDISIVAINSTRFINIFKSAKFKIVIKLKGLKTEFLTFRARLAFTKLR